jgi:plasmid stabilization system protein ParE
MYPVRFTQTARTEMIAAQDWYEGEVQGLGRQFRAAADAVAARISDNPKLFPVVYKTVPRALLRRFPYALMFVIEPDDTLLVIACFHGSRDPARWQRRV